MLPPVAIFVAIAVAAVGAYAWVWNTASSHAKAVCEVHRLDDLREKDKAVAKARTDTQRQNSEAVDGLERELTRLNSEIQSQRRRAADRPFAADAARQCTITGEEADAINGAP